MRYPNGVLSDELVREFTTLAHSADPDLAHVALLMARVAYPTLDVSAYVGKLDALGREAMRRVGSATTTTLEIPPHVDPDVFVRIAALNEFLFEDEHFVGNDTHYDDPRNSFLNEVLDRRTGIPITLAWSTWRWRGVPASRWRGSTFPGTS
jgi:regulator of sirC expression with transglutaminase-like and TPR domain